jgi:signal transduction histidine kinase
VELRQSIDLASNHLNRAMLFHHVLAGEVKPGISPVPVTYLLDDMVVATRALLGKGNGNDIVFTCETADDVDIWPMDRELVLVIGYHALYSAAMHAGSTVQISATIEDGMLALRVADDGPGFESLDEDGFHERGFGLFVAQRIVALHQRAGRVGRIELSNGCVVGRPGGSAMCGGFFTVFLP